VSDPELLAPTLPPNAAIPLLKRWNIPPLPETVVDRPEDLATLRVSLLRPEKRAELSGAIQGEAGIGKTVLAQLLAHDKHVRACFPDGIYWLSLGPEPDVLALLGDVIRIFDPAFRLSKIPEASAHLQGMLSERSLLLILDDVCKKEHYLPFLVGGEQCRVLLTTRSLCPAEDPDVPLLSLDVMTSPQALALFENCLARTFGATESGLALELATMAGFLPSTLHLVMMAMPTGTSWQEWTELFRQEITFLKAREEADRLPPNTDRQVSFEAALQLSLRELHSNTPQAPARFAWLGVTPEDVRLTPPMMAVVWQMDLGDTEALLELFCRKGLLLAAAPMRWGEGLCPCFRVHSLLYPIACRLLSAGSPHGLGLLPGEAHRLLLERYRERLPQRAVDVWTSLPDDGYIYEHLTWHMEKAEQFEAMNLLLKEETEEGKNAWFELMDRSGKTASYIADVRRSWRGVQRLSRDSYERGEPIRTLGLELRHCLILTSLNSLAVSLPMKMIVGFVRKGIWSSRVGLTYIKAMSNDTECAQWLGAIAPHLTGGQLREALTIVRALPDPHDRSWHLNQIVSQWTYPEKAWQLAAAEPSLVWMIKNSRYDSETFKSSLGEALRGIARALSAIGDTERALEVVQTIDFEQERAWTLIDILPSLSEAELHEVLSIALAMENAGYRIRVTAEIAKVWRDRGNIEQAFSIVERDALAPVWILAKMVPSIIPALTEDQLYTALSIVQRIDDATYRATTSVEIAIHLTHPEERAQLVANALALTPTIENPYWRAHALTKIAPYLTEEQLHVALTVARTVEDIRFGAPTVAEIAIHMKYPAEPLREAVQIAHTSKSPVECAETLAKIVARLEPSEDRAQILADAVAVARTSENPYVCAQALTGIAEKLDDTAQRTEIIAEAFLSIGKMEKARSCALMIHSIAPYLTQEQLPEAESIALAIVHAAFSGQALIEIAKAHIAFGDTAQALSFAQKVEDAFRRAEVLNAIIPCLPQAEERTRVVAEALSSADAVEDAYFRAMALANAAVCLQYVPFEHFYPLWTVLMQHLVPLYRGDIQRAVEQLSVALLDNGKSQTVEELLLALSDVARWWP